MINDKAILVGVDGSHASYKATWWAANYATHYTGAQRYEENPQKAKHPNK